MKIRLADVIGGAAKSLDQRLQEDMRRTEERAENTAKERRLKKEAQKAKEKIELLENYQAKSTVVNSKLNNIDVFSIISDSSHAYVNHLQVAFGRIVRFHNVEIKKKLEETDKELLLMTLVNLREKFSSKNNTVISNIKFDKILDLKFISPKAGDNKKLLDLSVRNATQFKIEKLKQV